MSFVRGNVRSQRQVHTIVWIHEEPERTCIFSTANDRTPEVLEGRIAMEDLGLELTASQQNEIQRATTADGISAKAIGYPVAYPEVSLEIFDDLHVLRRRAQHL